MLLCQYSTYIVSPHVIANEFMVCSLVPDVWALSLLSTLALNERYEERDMLRDALHGAWIQCLYQIRNMRRKVEVMVATCSVIFENHIQMLNFFQYFDLVLTDHFEEPPKDPKGKPGKKTACNLELEEEDDICHWDELNSCGRSGKRERPCTEQVRLLVARGQTLVIDAYKF